LPHSDPASTLGLEEAALQAPAAGSAYALAGSSLGDFDVLAEIGRGGMSIVYKARQRILERDVALKILRDEYLHRATVKERFLEEARSLAGLDHPNIVKVFQIGESFAGPYFTMELIDGPSLARLIKQGSVSISTALALMIPVAEGIHHVHERGIVHRDLKPSNILVRSSHRPVVMDFGLAKVTSKNVSLTEPGMIIGTPAFMAPEQAGGGWGAPGPHSDVYSLGAVLYALLAGRPPFQAGPFSEIVAQVTSAKPPTPLRQLRPEVPAQLERICMRCLNKQSVQRFASARELAQSLRSCWATLARSRSRLAIVRASRAGFYLVSLKSGQRIGLLDTLTILGRASECDVVLRHSEVSKRHCQVIIEDGKAYVEDLGSANGTFVNDRRVQRHRLKEGDRLHVASQAFQVRVGDPVPARAHLRRNQHDARDRKG
jgi:serine/threonine protein kinase